MIIENMEDVKYEIKQKIEKYFELKGVKRARNRKYYCFNASAHKEGTDQIPSISIYSGKSGEGTLRWKCFGCQLSGSTYDAAAILDNLDVEGDFLGATIHLADMLGIDVKIKEGREEYDDRMLKSIAQYIEDNNNHTLLMDGTFGRSYPEDMAIEVSKILPVANIDYKYIEDKLRLEYGPDALERLKIATEYERQKRVSSSVFNKDRMSSVLLNAKGRPVAFQSRASKDILKDTNKQVPKFQFTKPFMKNTELPLYFLHMSKKYIKESGRVYIVEGVWDAVAMFVAGYRNVVALLGTSYPEEALTYLLKLGIKEAVLCLDDDAPGIRARDAIFEKLAVEGLPVFFLNLGGRDPEEVVLAKETEQFEKLLDAIEYKLDSTNCFEDEHSSVARRYTECLTFVTTYCRSRALYSRYSAIISEILDLPIAEVMLDLSSKLDVQERNTPFIVKVRNRIKNTDELLPEELLGVLEEIQSELSEYVSKSVSTLSNQSGDLFQSFLDPNPDKNSLPYLFKTGYNYLDNYIRFESKSVAMITAPPSNLKSTFMRALSLIFLRMNPNSIGIYVSLDDTREKAMMAIISSYTGIDKLTIQESIKSGTFLELLDISQSDELSKLFKTQLFVVGKESAASMQEIKREIARVRKDNPDKNIFCVCDAMDDIRELRVSGSSFNKTSVMETILSEMSEIAVVHDVCFIMIKHLNKVNNELYRPSLFAIKGSSMVEYLAKTIILGYMSKHYRKETGLTWINDDGVICPVMELHVAKEKDTEANERLFIEVDPNNITFRVPNETKVDEYVRIYEAESKNIGRKTGNDDDDYGF